MAADILQRPYKAVEYMQMAATWQDYENNTLLIRLQDCTETFLLPLAFVAGSGNNTLRFVHELIQHMVNESGHISNLKDLGLTLDDEAVSGIEIFFAPNDPSVPFTWAKGPDGRDPHRAPGSDDLFDETDSQSASQMTDLHTDFREMLLIRDGSCVVTDAKFNKCQAAHLAPTHRHDIYKAALGAAFTPPAYKSAHGILLATHLHQDYDRFKWSFYANGDDLIFHAFHAEEGIVERHGHIVPSDTFTLKSGTKLPDRRLIAWHYKQCVCKYLRGFWVGEAVGA